MRSWIRAASAAVVLGAAIPAPGAAQGRNVPGAVRTDVREELSAYQKDVRRQTDEILARWRDAWGNRDAGVLADLYAREGVVVPLTGEPLRGQAAIRQGLPALLAKAGPIRTTPQDFGTSGEMAFSVDQFTYGREENGASAGVRTGTVVTIFRRHWDGRWEILSQTLALLPDAAD